MQFAQGIVAKLKSRSTLFNVIVIAAVVILAMVLYYPVQTMLFAKDSLSPVSQSTLAERMESSVSSFSPQGSVLTSLPPVMDPKVLPVGIERQTGLIQVAGISETDRFVHDNEQYSAEPHDMYMQSRTLSRI